MVIDATFWVAISFLIFIGALVYLKIPQKINELLNKLILDIKNEIDESEKLRQEAKVLLDSAQNKLDTAQTVSNDILQQAKKDSDHLIIEMNDKFHKSSEIKKNLAENKIPTPTNPIAATVKPMTEPPKNATLSASAAPFSLAATAVLTLALVAAYMPMKPAMPEHNDPNKNEAAVCHPKEK